MFFGKKLLYASFYVGRLKGDLSAFFKMLIQK